MKLFSIQTGVFAVVFFVINLLVKNISLRMKLIIKQ